MYQDSDEGNGGFNHLILSKVLYSYGIGGPYGQYDYGVLAYCYVVCLLEPGSHEIMNTNFINTSFQIKILYLSQKIKILYSSQKIKFFYIRIRCNLNRINQIRQI